MDTPESPTQSPQSPDEEEKGFSESELLESPESPAEEGNGVSDSELLNDDEVDADSDFDDEEQFELGGGAQEDISDLEDDKMDRDVRVHHQESAIRRSRSAELEGEGEILETPRSPDPDSPELDQPFTPADGEQEDIRQEDEDDGGEVTTRSSLSRQELDEDEEEEEEEERRRRRLMVVSDLKDSPSVSRDLDEHELDYDEEVSEEPSTAAPEEEDTEKGPAIEDGDEDEEEKEEEKKRKKERKLILPPDTQAKTSEESRGQERGRRDSFRDKKKDEDDGEIDEGEIDDDDLEEGEVKDPTDRKIRPRPICRFFMKGNCTWGMICRFIHPGVNDKGNYSLISKPDPFSPNGAPPGAGGPHPLMPSNPWTGLPVEELPPPPPPAEPPVESAWERGLRHAKEVLKKATIRKEQEPDFEEKRFNVTIGEDEWEFDKENDFFRERGYRITREIRDPGEVDFRDPAYSDPYVDPYYDYEMEAFWRGGQYENFRVQYTETPLPYHYNDRERDPHERHRERERERERDHRERERRQREREREREREKERLRRKEEWERDRLKRDEKEGRPRERPLREPREKKEEKDKPLKPRSPISMPPRGPMESQPKKETVPMVKRPDEWKDPWRRSKSPRRRPGLMGSPPRGRRRHRPSGSSVSLSNSSRSSSRSSSYTGSGSSHSRSRSRSSSLSSYSTHSSQHSSFTGSHSRSRSFTSSPSPTPSGQRNTGKNKAEQPPGAMKGHLLKPGMLPPPRRDKGSSKKMPSPSLPGKPLKPLAEAVKPPNIREVGRPAAPREPAKPPNVREGRRKDRQPHDPRRRTLSGSVSGSGSSFSGSSSRSRSRSSSASLSHSRSGSHKSRSLTVSSVSSVSSASSSSSSVRSADSDDMYADLASPVSSASSRSPTPGHTRKEKVLPRDRDANKERGKPTKRDETFKDERKRVDQSGLPPKPDLGMARSAPGNRGHPMNAPPMSSAGGYGSHKDIKLTLLNKQQADRSNRKRYFPADKDRPTSPLSKRMALSPDRGRDRRPGRSPLSPRMDRPRGQGPRPMPPQGDRKRPQSPPPKSTGKGLTASAGKSPAPVSGSGKPSSTLSRREELLKQLKAVEDAIARKRAKIPGK
ncbi:zinc finger CCCH domain-containing protein 18 isoform X2 [Tachysurus ichikawai]